MLRQNLEFEHQQRATALEVVQRRLAIRERDLRALRAYSTQLEERLAAEKSRADRLAALAERFGSR